MFDLGNLKKIPKLGTLAPRTMAGFKALDEAALTHGTHLLTS
jgi:hypothetical protein